MAETKFDKLEERVAYLEKLLKEKVSQDVQTVLSPIQLTKNASGVFEEVPVIAKQPTDIQGF